MHCGVHCGKPVDLGRASHCVTVSHPSAPKNPPKKQPCTYLCQSGIPSGEYLSHRVRRRMPTRTHRRANEPRRQSLSNTYSAARLTPAPPALDPPPDTHPTPLSRAVLFNFPFPSEVKGEHQTVSPPKTAGNQPPPGQEPKPLA